MMGEMSTTTAQLAGFWRRFASAIIDGIIVGVIGQIIGAILVHGDSRQAAVSGLGIVIGLAYYTWGFGSGQTLGCRVLNLKIVDQDTGGVPGYGKGLIRYLVSIISGIVLLIGYL